MFTCHIYLSYVYAKNLVQDGQVLDMPLAYSLAQNQEICEQ